MAKVFVITGPSGVGKGTLIRELRARLPQLALSTSATTRRAACRERPTGSTTSSWIATSSPDGRTKGEFVEHAVYSGNRYGTLRSELERHLSEGESVVLEIEVQGARQVRAAMPEAVLLFIAPPDPAELRQRLEGRGADSEEAIAERLRTAELELDAQEEFQRVIVNDDLDQAIGELEQVVRDQL